LDEGIEDNDKDDQQQGEDVGIAP
jgi:hypothetical protein